MTNIKKRLGNLLTIKSLITLMLTVVFAYMSIIDNINQDFMTIYTVIISFYFGTQLQKNQNIIENNKGGDIE